MNTTENFSKSERKPSTTKFRITSKTFNIEGGPSTYLLVDAFKYAYDPTVKVPVSFVVAGSYTCPPGNPGCAYTALEMTGTTITSLQHESGNNYSFNIEGFCPEVGLVDERGVIEYVYAKFTAYYNARTRKGKITFRLN